MVKHAIRFLFFFSPNWKMAHMQDFTPRHAECKKRKKERIELFLWLWVRAHGCPHHQSVLWRAPEVFFIKVSSTSEVQQISDPLGCNGFSAPCFTSNLKCLRAFLSLVFTQDCFFREPRLSVTLKTNKTTSAVLICFERLWRNRPDILSWQTAASEVIDRPACRHHYLPMEQNVSPSIPLCFSLRIVCSLPFWKGALYGGERWEKIFLSCHQWINGDVFTCLRAQCSLHNNGH